MGIELLAPAAADDGAVMSALADLVNDVYAAAEEGLWTEGTARTSAAEIASFTRAGEVAVAFAPGPGAASAADDGFVGFVRIQRLAGDVSEFGMLAVDPASRGSGLGRDLVRFAERRGRDLGCAAMQLELLVPREWKHPFKEFLAEWYARLGYAVIGTRSTEELYPHLSPLLATPCEFQIYRKDLGA